MGKKNKKSGAARRAAAKAEAEGGAPSGSSDPVTATNGMNGHTSPSLSRATSSATASKPTTSKKLSDDEFEDADEDDEEDGHEEGDEPELEPGVMAENKKESGNAAFKAGRYWDAVDLYSEAIRLVPSSSTYLSNRAAAYMAARQYPKALTDCQSALSLFPSTSSSTSPSSPTSTATDPAYQKLLLRLVKIHLCLGNPSSALSLSSSLPPKYPGLPQETLRAEQMMKNIQRAENARRKKDWGDLLVSLREAEKGLGLDGANGMVMVEEGGKGVPEKWRIWRVEALLGKKRTEEATDLATEILRASPSSSEAMLIRGKVLYQIGAIQQALKHFKEALNLDPDLKEAMTLLKRARAIESKKEEGNQAFKTRNWREAAERYTEALDMEDDNEEMRITLLSNRAQAYLKLGDHDRALSDCDTVLGISPKHFKAFRTRGRTNLAKEDYEGALRDLKEAYEYAPSGSVDEKNLRDEVKEAQKELKRSKQKDYYKVLGVGRDADDVEIKKAYRKMSLQHHPDKGGSEEKFKEIGEAHAILSDPMKRRRHDAGGDDDDDYGGDGFGFPGGGGGGGYSFAFGGGGPGGMGGGINVEDFLGGGGGFGGGRRGHSHGFSHGYPF